MYEVLIILFLLLLTISVYQKITNAKCSSKKRLDGQTVIVTGGTAGIGLEIATDLARRGARVIVACPFGEEGTSARDLIVEKTKNTNVIFKFLDQSSLESVRKFATDVLNTEERLDILINNAGIGVPKDVMTSDGMNVIMQVNYFGAFLLTILLLPLLKKTGQPRKPSRIIMTASKLNMIGKIDIDKLNEANHWMRITVYGKSKLCVTEFTRQLVVKLEGFDVVINSVDPGTVGTRIFNSFNVFVGPVIKYFLNILLKTPWQGAQTALYVALDTEAGEVSGKYFKNCALAKCVPSVDDKASSELWDESVKLVKLTEEEIRHCLKSEKQ